MYKATALVTVKIQHKDDGVRMTLSRRGQQENRYLQDLAIAMMAVTCTKPRRVGDRKRSP